MTEESALTDEIVRAQGLAINGDREGAWSVYEQLWAEAARVDDRYQACVAAHFMAHAQVEPEAQRDWHLRALHAADAVCDERVRAFYPSLYANLGEVYLRLGDRQQAQQYVERAREAEHVLQDDGYGWMIRSLIARLTEAIAPDSSSC